MVSDVHDIKIDKMDHLILKSISNACEVATFKSHSALLVLVLTIHTLNDLLSDAHVFAYLSDFNQFVSR